MTDNSKHYRRERRKGKQSNWARDGKSNPRKVGHAIVESKELRKRTK